LGLKELGELHDLRGLGVEINKKIEVFLIFAEFHFFVGG